MSCHRKARLAAVFSPPALIIGLILSVFSSEATTRQPTTLSSQQSHELASKPSELVKTEEPSATYLITVVKTGLDFQYSYEGELEVYAGKTTIEATWAPECGDSASVDF